MRLTTYVIHSFMRIVDPRQYHESCRRLDVTQFTLFMVLYLCRMCQRGLQAVLWTKIGILMRLLAAEPLNTA